MANLQQQFSKFHKKIKVEKEELKNRRNIIVNKIKKSLKGKGRPVLDDVINQGSYIYGVGIKPISSEDDYDIDVGLVFDIESEDYCPTAVRKWVFDAIKNHTKNVKEKGSCIRVKYVAGYHVDLVIYAKHENLDGSEKLQLAHKDGTWRDADPKALKAYTEEAREPFDNSKDSSGSDQLQRVVRYLKRWNDKNLPDGSKDKPSGLALLLLAIKYLKNPVFDGNDSVDDLNALRKIALSVERLGRIFLEKPTPEYEDVFGKISDEGMDDLIKRFRELDCALKDAAEEEDLEKACEILRDQFGNDFPLDKDKGKSSNFKPMPIVGATKPYAN